MRKRNNGGYAEVTLYHRNLDIGEPVTGAEKYTCCNVSNSCLRWTIGVLAVIAAFSIIGVVIASFVTTEDIVANQRYLINGASANGVGSVTGQMQFNTNSRQIVWDFIPINMTTPFQSIGIHGPIAMDQPDAPPFVNICGTPTTLVCTLQGYIQQTSPEGLSLQQFIVDIRDRPMAYYVNITTGTYPSLDVRAQLGTSSGKP